MRRGGKGGSVCIEQWSADVGIFPPLLGEVNELPEMEKHSGTAEPPSVTKATVVHRLEETSNVAMPLANHSMEETCNVATPMANCSMLYRIARAAGLIAGVERKRVQAR